MVVCWLDMMTLCVVLIPGEGKQGALGESGEVSTLLQCQVDSSLASHSTALISGMFF
jgi:hypothetical protein